MAVRAGIHEEILYDNAWRDGPAEDVEIDLQVGIAIGIVGAEALAGKTKLCGIVQAGSKCIGLGISPCGVSTPAGCIEPFITLTRCIGVDGNEDDIILAQKSANLIDTSASFGQRDIGEFRHEQLSIVTEAGQG